MGTHDTPKGGENMTIQKKNYEYGTPLKTVGGNEGDKCVYPTRLDTYGKGCYFDCKYCYAKSLLDFRGYWKPNEPSIARKEDIIQIIKQIKPGECLRLGGMTDCFQPKETIHRITYNTIRALNKRKIHYLIVTKNNLIIRPEYMEVLDPILAHIQVSIPSTNNKILHLTDNAPPFEQRKKTVETLQKEGYDVGVRLSPFLYDHVDFGKLNRIRCDKILVEFLRINGKIARDMMGIINEDEFMLNENNYRHLSLS